MEIAAGPPPFFNDVKTNVKGRQAAITNHEYGRNTGRSFSGQRLRASNPSSNAMSKSRRTRSSYDGSLFVKRNMYRIGSDTRPNTPM